MVFKWFFTFEPLVSMVFQWFFRFQPLVSMIFPMFFLQMNHCHWMDGLWLTIDIDGLSMVLVEVNGGSQKKAKTQKTEHVYKKELYKHLKWKCRRSGGRFKGRRWCNIICILLLPQIVFDPREPNQTSTQISEISFSLNLSKMNEIDSWRQNCTFQSLTK